jgi:hypothetical protein
MNEWYNLPSPGKCWHFLHIVESELAFDEPMEAAVAAFTAACPVVRPLSVSLQMAARSRELPYIEPDIPVPFSTWHIREVEVPAHVAVAARAEAAGHREEAVPKLTPQELSRWVANAHAQPLEDGYVPVLYSLEMYYTRARLLEDADSYAAVAYGPERYTVPIERRPDGLWVSGPIRDTMTNPPIHISVENNDGRLTLMLCAGWSPWVERGSAEAALLRRCLDEIGRQGWDERTDS